MVEALQVVFGLLILAAPVIFKGLIMPLAVIGASLVAGTILGSRIWDRASDVIGTLQRILVRVVAVTTFLAGVVGAFAALYFLLFKAWLV